MATRPSVVAKLRRSGIALDAHYLPPHASHPIQPKAMPLLRSFGIDAMRFYKDASLTGLKN